MGYNINYSDWESNLKKQCDMCKFFTESTVL